MKCGAGRLRMLVTLVTMLFLSYNILAEEGNKNIPGGGVDSIAYSRRLIHRLGVDARPTYIFPTNSFLRGENMTMTPIRKLISAHLKYSFQYFPNSYTDRIYRGAYQDIGLGYYSFEHHDELGNPLAIYLFQGARIARFNPRLSLNYEWNFGVSFGWEPHNSDYNYYNKVIDSKINAYINANFYFNYILSRQVDLVAGVDLTHFSNGNTRFPNAGLNTVGLRVGLVYNFNRNGDFLSKPSFQPPVPRFPRHISYDAVVFGSWRRKGVYIDETSQVAAPGAFAVAGFCFNPMYNFGYNFRAGVSLDGVYDESANIYTDKYDSDRFYRPLLSYQMALGLSARAEYAMPYFSVNIGVGGNIIHRGGDLKGLYQVLALKIEVTRSSFIHIGYNL
ncbi:MAG: acyloxyacyl hydrolase [Parabacteroides sp.]|nr:acyloxyacyl hydrolase [Parabacteroides sp.]